MLDVRFFSRGSFKRAQPRISATTQAFVVIPGGVVSNACRYFEQLILAHHYERDSVYIDRAMTNMKTLIRQKRTYAQQLQAAEDATLLSLPPHLIDFLRDHDNLYRAAFRSRKAARKARKLPLMDVLIQTKCRLESLRIACFVNLIEMTGSIDETRRLKHDPGLNEEFDECTLALQDEIVHQLTRLEQLIPSPTKDVELENVGPDHSIDDFGQEQPPHHPSATSSQTAPGNRDPSQHCCICLEVYSESHKAFLITACNHTVGKQCLARWLNSTSRNANLCPHCRAPLCERRPRRPASVIVSHREISVRVGRAIIMLGIFEKLQEELFGRGAGFEYTKKAMDGLNYRLFQRDVGFRLDREGMPGGRWGIRRMRWH